MHCRSIAVNILALMAACCSGSHAHDAPSDASADSEAFTDATPDATPPDVPPPVGECTPFPQGFYVVSELRVGRVASDGTAPGLDLDGVVSDSTSAEGCFQPDFTSPRGVEGVDNQFARLVPVLDSALGETLDSTIADDIASGGLVLLIEYGAGASTSPQLALYLGRVPGGRAPELDATGHLVAGQTFDITPLSVEADGTAVLVVPGASTRGSTLSGGPVDLQLTFPTGDGGHIRLPIRDGVVLYDVVGDCEAATHGLIAGHLDIDDLVADGAPPASSVRWQFEGVADLNPNDEGLCQAISIAMQFETVPAVRGVVAAE